jgi:cytidylate kinase
MDYIDRLVLAEASKRIGATLEAVEQKEARLVRLRDRISRFVQRMLERSALSGAGGEPYFGTGYDILLARDYPELTEGPVSSAQQLDDRHFLEVTTAVIQDLARQGDVVINGRGSNIILKDWPGVLHIGLWAHMDKRVSILMTRHHIHEHEARDLATRMETARKAYFRKFFKADPYHPSHYDLMINMDKFDFTSAANVIIEAAKGIVQTAPARTE